jgi:NAD(P)H-flavin reductase
MMRIVARELIRLGVPDWSIYVSIERNMKCAIGFCGHCQFGPDFVCRSGAVMPFDRVAARMGTPEI